MHSYCVENSLGETEELILRMQEGENNLRDDFIRSNWNTIMYHVTRLTGRVAYNCDEFSIALMAFNEAIDHFDHEKNASFQTFSSLVINRRIIDYKRKMSKFNCEQLHLVQHQDGEDATLEISDKKQEHLLENLEIQEEILRFEENLAEFGISLSNIAKITPKHHDTRYFCACIATWLSESRLTSGRLLMEKKLPVTEIMSQFQLSRKTVDRHRKYIILLYLIIRSDMDILKGYLHSFMKGEQ